MDINTTQQTSTEEGFGLVEVVIAMLMLALLALAFAPVLVLGANQTKTNATLATATQFASQALDFPRSSADTCAGVRARIGSVSKTDARGTQLTVATAASACPSSYPGTVRLDVSVVQAGSPVVLTAASTLVYVAAAS